jgi:hypothetical protein
MEQQAERWLKELSDLCFSGRVLPAAKAKK